MKLRTIMIFPEFENMEILDNIRNHYDPLAKLVRPHITVGKSSAAKLLENAFNSLKSMNDTFDTIVNKVSVEMIGNDGKSIIVIEKKIGLASDLTSPLIYLSRNISKPRHFLKYIPVDPLK